MAEWRKVDVAMWADAKFRSLSAIPPCGQGLWVWLLTGPQTSRMPGVFAAGRAGMAEQIRWPQRQFDDAWEQVAAAGMVMADFDAPLVFVPNALRYNLPASPNVITSWRSVWQAFPECRLKHTIWTTYRDELEAFSPAFGDAFGRACGEPEVPGGAPVLDCPDNPAPVLFQAEPSGPAVVDPVDVAAIYAELLPSLPQSRGVITKTQAGRRILAAIKARAREYGMEHPDDWRQYFERVAASPFLMGSTPQFRADLTWLTSPTNMDKVLAGKYDRRRGSGELNNQTGRDWGDVS